MDSGDTGERPKPVPIRAEVVSAGGDYGEEVRARCYALWAFRAARNNRAVERLYAAEMGEGADVPSYNTIRRWAMAEGWEERRRADFAANHGETLYDMQLDALGIMRRHIDVMAEAQAGAYDDNPAAGIVRLKPGELLGKVIERGILPLMPKPQERALDADAMSKDDAEAHAMRQIARGRKGRSA